MYVKIFDVVRTNELHSGLGPSYVDWCRIIITF